MRRLKPHGLSLFFLVIFLAALAGQAIAGHADYNDEEIAHARLLHEQPQTLSFGRYLTSSAFAQGVTENWQSEYLQFTLYVFMTVWLVQRGSPESKKLEEAGLESDEDQLVGEHARPDSPRWAKVSGVRRKFYENSLVIAMLAIWVACWFAQSVSGWSMYNADQLEHKEQAVSWLGYIGTASFWEDTLQNWQSEFLAVGSFAVLAIYLRQRGSPESKPVGASHESTGIEG
jgi:hypothetical protein